MTYSPARRTVQKVVAYVVHDGRVLVFTHDDVPVELAGVQVPAGTIESGETPELAVVREVREETGLATRIVRALGVERYDVWPSKPEIHERHFFQLEVIDPAIPERWAAGEDSPSEGAAHEAWTCWWLPLEHAHVLAAGFGSRIAAVDVNGDTDQ